MTHLCGWMGTILRVDLTRGIITKEPLSEELRNDFIGGYGIGSKILYDETGPETNALSPENRLIVATGPLNGTLVPSTSRISVVNKSAVTNILAYSSGGGHFAPTLKYAGYDAIVIQGRAKKPVYLWIDDDKVEIRDATHLWGKTISETYELLQEEHGYDIHSLGIGPGGENLVKYACLITDDMHAPGAGDAGCIMGSKNLKTIVVRGTKPIYVAAPDKLFEITEETLAQLKAAPMYQTCHQFGWSIVPDWAFDREAAPVKNFEYSWEIPKYGPNQWDLLRSKYVDDNYPHRGVACFGCPLRCSSWVDLDERFGRYACKAKRPEGSILLAGPMTLTNNWPALVKFTELCNQYSLGAHETPSVISAALEWYEKGIITKEDTDGLELRFGDPDILIELTHKIAKREGFGNILAEGVFEAGKIVNAPMETVPHGKGKSSCMINVGAMDPGGVLVGATNRRGYDWLDGWAATSPGVTRWEKIFQRLAISPTPTGYNPNWAVANIITEDEYMMGNLLGTCIMAGIQYVGTYRDEGDMPYYASALSAVTGVDFDPEQLIRIAERCINIQKAYNVRLGLGRKDDQVHIRFREAPDKGVKFSQEGFDKMLSRYYELHGWDPRTGIPRRDTLEELGLKYVADDLERRSIQLGKGGHKYDINDISLELRGIKLTAKR